MKKQTKIVMFSITFLLIATACLWFLNGGSIGREGGGWMIAITENGEIISEVDMEYIRGLESETFDAVVRSSGQRPVEAEFTGVLLQNVLAGKNINLAGTEHIIIKGIDGYVARLSVDELDEKDIFIAYEMGGRPLKPREQGGSGPFQLISPNDPFSMRWCKFVVEVELK